MGVKPPDFSDQAIDCLKALYQYKTAQGEFAENMARAKASLAKTLMHHHPDFEHFFGSGKPEKRFSDGLSRYNLSTKMKRNTLIVDEIWEKRFGRKTKSIYKLAWEAQCRTTYLDKDGDARLASEPAANVAVAQAMNDEIKRLGLDVQDVTLEEASFFRCRYGFASCKEMTARGLSTVKGKDGWFTQKSEKKPITPVKQQQYDLFAEHYGQLTSDLNDVELETKDTVERIRNIDADLRALKDRYVTDVDEMSEQLAHMKSKLAFLEKRCSNLRDEMEKPTATSSRTNAEPHQNSSPSTGHAEPTTRG